MTKESTAWRLEAEASRLAAQNFGTNLVLSFVGGSYARGVSRPTSDVDLFVILEKPDRLAERSFALEFLRFHQRHSLTLTHCGEVFSVETLEHLLTVTEQILEQLPEIQHVGCYHGDCILSAFRKGDVVFKFLADSKTEIAGDRSYLTLLEDRAEVFFRRFPMRRVQLEKGRLILDESSAASRLEQAYHVSEATPAFADTPGGIGLERWFGPSVLPAYPPEPEYISEALELSPEDRRQCPLSMWPQESRRGALLRHQCLGLLIPNPEEHRHAV